jgi:hypothetical protein
MDTWMLSKFYINTENGFIWPVAATYSNGHVCPRFPDDVENGWALVKCNSTPQQIQAAMEDPRVLVYRSLWDPVTPDTISAHATTLALSTDMVSTDAPIPVGGESMVLGQLLRLLGQVEPGYF